MERNNGYTHLRRQGQMSSPGVTRRPPNHSRETLTQHDELIKYINEAWVKVTESEPRVYNRCENEQPRFPGFTPFDLEGYWGRKLMQNIHISQGHQ